MINLIPAKYPIDRNRNWPNNELMRPVWISLIALLITITSVMTEVPSHLHFNTESHPSLETLPSWEAEFLLSPGKKLTEKHHLIAEGFIPIVLIADEQDPKESFIHYISVYNLQRPKEFFLLL